MRRYCSLRGRREFALVLRRGKPSSTKHLVVFALVPSGSAPQAKIGIVITKKVGKAVERNRLRRRCKAILDETAIVASGTWFVIQCKPTAGALTFAHLREQLKGALQDSLRRAGNAPPRREPIRR